MNLKLESINGIFKKAYLETRMLWSTKNTPSWVKCQHILFKTGKLVALMFFALLFKIIIKAFVKYYAEVSRQEDCEKWKHL